MLFNSLEFLVFLPTVVGLHFLTPARWRWIGLLAASCLFYMWFVPEYILILAVTITLDYFVAIVMDRREGAARRAWLVAGIIANVAFLLFFKYFAFFDANLSTIYGWFGATYERSAWKILLPIGLSFHTFQSLSYLIEVYRRDQPVERHAGYLSLYVMFFPQLVAGPIERPQNLLHQLRTAHRFDLERTLSGAQLMIWGFFKKLVVADRLAVYVNQVYNDPHTYAGLPLIIATVFFAFQLYCDFSGYSDIAIGTARIFGVNLMENFRRPYFSASFSEFWRRWHISLSTWFRDYLYIPLGGNRVAGWRVYFNLMLVFTVSGLWHGANWTFVIWGALHGGYLCVERFLGSILARFRGARGGALTAAWTAAGTSRPQEAPTGAAQVWLHGGIKALRIAFIFACVCFTYIFFRANAVDDAFYIAQNMFAQTRSNLFVFPLEELLRKTGLLVIALLVGLELLQSSARVQRRVERWRAYGAAYVYYAALLAIIALAGVFYGSSFIYFQF